MADICLWAYRYFMLSDALQMNGVLSHGCTLQGYTGPWTTWANEMNFVMNRAPVTGLLTRPVDQGAYTVPWMPLGCIAADCYYYNNS